MRPILTARTRRLALVAFALLVTASAPGCVRRRLMIRSNPPGAMAYVDNQPIGITPCAASFVYYGTREIRLVKPGYETLTVNQSIPAPWYEIPPLDFASENLVPKEIQDFRTVTYTLTPQAIHPTEQIIARGEQLRASTQQGAVLPAAVAAPTGAATPGPPTMFGPALSAPTGGSLSPPGWYLEPLSPGIPMPTTPGQGSLPPGGRPLEALPTPSN